MKYKFNNKMINCEEGRTFIIKVVDFFVNTVIEETEHKMSIAPKPEKEIAIRYYKNYKFIRDSLNISKPNKDLYYELVRNYQIELFKVKMKDVIVLIAAKNCLVVRYE